MSLEVASRSVDTFRCTQSASRGSPVSRGHRPWRALAGTTTDQGSNRFQCLPGARPSRPDIPCPFGVPVATARQDETECSREGTHRAPANLNIHLHCLVLDGVYLNRDGVAVFHEAAAPSTDELEAVLLKIITRTMRLLTRLGALIEEPERTYLAETDSDGALKSLQAASCTYRIALGPRAGQKC